MKNFSNVQTLQDLVRYGNTESYTIPNSTYQHRYENLIILDNLIYDKYDSVLRQNSYLQTFTDEEFLKYIYRPDIMALDLYDNPALGHLILYLNHCSEDEFTSPIVRILNPNIIGSVFSYIMANEGVYMKKNNAEIVG